MDSDPRARTSPSLFRSYRTRGSSPHRAPALLVRLELEQQGEIKFEAAHHEDELRLRSWLRSSRAFRRLSAILERALDDLDEAA